jgi:TolB-like protein/DNA-binding winged helix-turn-helix (wHTH) protein/Tfp pilus assembly protein PilF
MAPQDSGQSIRFGVFELDLRAGELRRSGVRLPIQGHPLQVLAVLLRTPGEVVTREQLRAELWQADTFVDFEHGVHNAVARLRAVLGDTASTPRFIETIPRRGYRFIATAESARAGRATPEPPPQQDPAASTRLPVQSRRLRIALGAFITVAAAGVVMAWMYPRALARYQGAQIASLAVLPLENLSGDPAQDYLADGITDELITTLASTNTLKVISRPSVMQYKSVRKPLPLIAKKLGVDAVVTGTVVHSGDKVRITAQLVHAPTDRHLWAERYERSASDIVLLEHEIATAIAGQVNNKLSSQEQRRPAVKPINPAAHQLYLRGRYFWNKRTAASVRMAIGYFTEAVAQDPSFAAAYSGLADCYSSLGFSFDVGDMAPHDAQSKALEAAQRAIGLDQSLAEAHSSLAFIKLNYQWDWPGADAEFRRALSLNSGSASAHHWYAHYLISAGRATEAEAESRRALDLDPLNPIINVHLGWHYFYARQYDWALDQFRKTLELDPHYGLAHWYRGLVYEQKGMYGDALSEMRRGKDLLSGNTVVDSDIGHLYAITGNRAAATRILAELEQRRRRAYVSPFEIALIRVGLKQMDAAFRSFEEAYRERSDMLVYLKVDPRLDPIRTDTRFRALVQRIGIPQ